MKKSLALTVFVVVILAAALCSPPVFAADGPLAPAPPRAAEAVPPMQVPIRDITSIAGVRDNMLIGYGLVVGLQGTGDRMQTHFTTQTLGNVLEKMGVQVSPQQIMTENVAAVFVTATLPPFARPGMYIDVTVSSTGDARSLAGGLLLLSALHGPDGTIYAEAQGPITVGGFNAGGGGNQVRVNQTNVGIIPSGGIVERDTAINLSDLKQLSLLLREPNFITSQRIATAINAGIPGADAHAVDSREVDVKWPTPASSIPEFLSRIESLSVSVTPPARVVVDERTGTIVIGSQVQLGPVSILHGDLAIQVRTTYQVSQPAPLSKTGTTEVVPQTQVNATDAPASQITLPPGATVQDLVNGLQAIGATARDIVSILRAIKAAGALEAQLVVI